jgi:alpha-glucuronidase
MDRNLMRVLRAAWVPVLFLISMHAAFAETGAEAWLRYSQVKDGAASLPTRVAVVGNSEVVRTAGSELVRALQGKPGKAVPTV